MLDRPVPGSVASARAELPAEWFEALLDALPMPLVLLEPRSGRLLFANTAADALAGGEFPRMNAEEPLLRAAAGERLSGVPFEWRTHSLVVDADLLPEVQGQAPVVMVTFADVTDLTRQEHLKDETVAVLDTLFFSAPVGLAFFDPDLRYVRVNDVLAQMNGLPASAHVGRRVGEVLPEMDPGVAPSLHKVLKTGEPVVDAEVVGRTPAVPGQDRHWVASFYPVRHRTGVTLGIGAVIVEVTERVRLLESERRARERAERAERRSAFLARAGEVLNASLDYQDTLRQLAALAVPAKADWCAIDMRDPLGRLHRIAVRHVDPTKEQLGRELFERWPPRPEDAEGVWWVLRTGRPVLYREITPELLTAITHDREQLEIVEALGLRSAMIVPLRARGKVVGAMSFVLAESGGSYHDEDLQLAMEVARSASAAIENASLHDQVRYIARTLQSSLLPPRLPEIPGFELAARYRAAGEGFEVGGDFYDVFPRHGRSWAFALGDVVGKGPEAAALTALARYATRAAAIEHPEPAVVLELLNEAILREHRADRYMTAICATLEVDPVAPRLVLASAGHPPALLLRGDTAVEVGGGGRMLGIEPEVAAPEAEIFLQPGDAVVLYTDGITDAAAPKHILHVDDLRGAVESAAGSPADHIAAALEHRALLGTGGQARDDIAIVVLRYAG